MPILLSLLAGLFALTGCEKNKSTAPDPKTLSFDVSGVVAEGALIKGASVSLYLSGADSSLDSTTSDSQGRYSFTLEGIRANTLSLRLVATYMEAGEAITLRSYVDLRGRSSSQSQELTANINEITEFAFTLASVQTEIGEEALNTLNRIIDRVSDVLGVEGNLDFRTSPYDRTLDSYQELIQFQEQTDDPSMIDILRKDNDTVVTNFGKILLTDVDPPQSIQETIDAFQNHTIMEEIISVRDLPIPTLASGAPGEVTRLSATSGKEEIILSWSDPEDANFDHVEISWMVDGGTSSEPVSVPAGDGTFTVTDLEGDVLYNFTIVTSDSEGNTSAGVRISETPSPDIPPMITPIADKMVQADATPLKLIIIATDPDGETPSLAYSPILDYATFTDRNDGTATLVFNPGGDVAPGPTNIIITATSGKLSAREEFSLTITAPPDSPPVIDSIIPDPVTVRAGETTEVQIMASDPDAGQTPTLSLDGTEPQFVFIADDRNGSATITISPGGDETSDTITINVVATSRDKATTNQFTLNIAPADNNPPIITTIENQTVPAGSSLIVSITATDPDDGQTPSLAYSPALDYATLTPTGKGTADLILNPGRDVSPGPTNITITASSGKLTDMEQFTLTITVPADRPPVIASIIPNPVAVRAGETNRVTVTASDPDSGETPTLSLDGTELQFVSIADDRNGSATINISPGEDAPPDTITINVVATSGDKATTNDFILIIASLSAVDGDGDGVLDIVDVDDDNDGLIEINSLEDLDDIRYNLAGTSYKTSDTDLGNMNGAPGSGLKGYELVRGLDFNDPTSYESNEVNTAWTTESGWLPIGNNRTDDDMTRFTGILEGNGYKITNLMIRRYVTFVGLFGYIGTSGQVRNLGIENAVADYTGSSGVIIGLLTGRSDGRISSVSASGNVSGGSGDLDAVGGLVGLNDGQITASYAMGMADGGDGNNDAVGGLVGVNHTGGTITACYATGNADGGEGRGSVGGLVGFNRGLITASYATGMADGGGGNGDAVGGLAGFNEGQITACYATGMASSGSGTQDTVGGLVGFNHTGGTITACYATGMASGGSGTQDAVGGLVGVLFGGTITACYATGNANGDDGRDFVGGLAGVLQNGTITASYGFGTVTGEVLGVGRSGDASPTVTNASALIMTNSSMMRENQWPARVWDFGTDSQAPALKWITGYNRRGDTDEAKYPCDEALLPAGGKCGDIIPGQSR